LVQSSADHQYQYAKHVTQNWANAASNVMLSYPLSNGDTPRLMSPLLEPYPAMDKAALLQHEPINDLEQRIGGEALYSIEDISGPVVTAGAISHGGTAVLKDQSACPFKAFAHHRLRAKAIEEPELGIDARLRGSLVHRSLEGVWKQIKTQQALALLTIEAQCDLVLGCVIAVIERESYRTPLLKKALGQLEVQRISALLLDWLSIDRARAPFTVQDTELRQVLKIGELQLNTVIDRVDRLQDGSLAVIDYKTGATSLSSWFGERPEDPQLPLYSVFGGEGVQSISFAQLKKGEVKYVGLTDRNQHFSELKSLDEGKVKSDAGDWAGQMKHWERTMTSLSAEFMGGDAPVNPTKKACDYCDLTSLCRINEQEFVAELNDE